MRIGLIRHFPVALDLPTGWRTAAELQSWRESYDVAEIQIGGFDLGGIAWQACLSSDLPRARLTAGAVYRGDVEQTNLMRELEFGTFNTGSLRLPLLAWQCLLRVAWMTGHRSQRASRDDTHRRIQAVADQLSAASEDTLVVSHAGTMAYLSAELRRRRFAGPKLGIAKHAAVYVYERPDAESAIE